MNIRVALKKYNRKQLPDVYGAALRAMDAGTPRSKIPFKQVTGPQVKDPVRRMARLYAAIKKQGPAKTVFVKGEVEGSGHLLVRGGYHRLSILHHLGYKSVMVRVKPTKRFKKFWAIMYEMQGKGRKMYYPLDYWALSTWPHERGTNRPGLVMKGFPKQGQFSFLDLGCYIGHVGHALARKGHSVIGVDRSANPLFCANYLADYYDSMKTIPDMWKIELAHVREWYDLFKNYKRPGYIQEGVPSFLASAHAASYDYVLYLSLHRWLRKGKADIVSLMRNMDRITRKGIFVDARIDAENVALAAITTHTRFKKIRSMGVEKHGNARYHRVMFVCEEL